MDRATNDARLSDLGDRLCDLTIVKRYVIDIAGASKQEPPDTVVDALDRVWRMLADEVVAVPAAGMEGLRAKARTIALMREPAPASSATDAKATVDVLLADSLIRDLLT